MNDSSNSETQGEILHHAYELATPHPSKAVQLIQKVVNYCHKQVDANSDEALLWAQCKTLVMQAQDEMCSDLVSVVKSAAAIGEAGAEFKKISKERWTKAYQSQIDELIRENHQLSAQRNLAQAQLAKAREALAAYESEASKQ